MEMRTLTTTAKFRRTIVSAADQTCIPYGDWQQ